MPQYELNLRDYLRILSKRKWIIVATFLAASIGGGFYTSMRPPVYETTTTVKIEERQTIAGLLTEWISYTPADIMESQTKIITGYPIMKKVALSLELIDDSFSTQEAHSVILGLQGKIVTETIKNTNIIKITVATGNAQEAAELANMVARVYIEENLLEKTQQARGARQFIEEQLAELEKRLKNTEERLREFGREVKDIRLAESIQKQLAELEFQLAALLQKYTDKHPQVIRLRNQLEGLEAQLVGFSGQDLEYARLEREVEVNKNLYAMLKEKLEEARITEAQKIGDVSLVDPAIVPQSSSGPTLGISLVMGGALGLFLGIALAFMLETLDTSIGTIEDVENTVKLPVLGVVPATQREMEENKSPWEIIKDKIIPPKKDPAWESYMRLLVHHKPHSPIAEAYRQIRTNLSSHSSLKTLLFTSAGPGEGKSTIVTNLGLTFAQKGVKTLLVSADLRRPVLAKSFGMKREPGLNEVITGVTSLDEALRSVSDMMLGNMLLEEVIKAPGIENMWLLPAGRLPLNPTEILESPEMTKLIEELKGRFEIIFFDAPPVLPIADSSLLAPRMDGTILCYEIGRTSRDALLRAKIQLEAVGTKITGIILNHTRPESETLAPYPYYKYKY